MRPLGAEPRERVCWLLVTSDGFTAVCPTRREAMALARQLERRGVLADVVADRATVN